MLPNTIPSQIVKKSIMEQGYIFASKISVLTLFILATLQQIFPLYTYLQHTIDIFSNITVKIGLSDYSDTIITLTPWLYITQSTPNNTDLHTLLILLNSVGGICITIFTWIFAITIIQSNKIAFSAGLIILSSLFMLIIPYIMIDCILFSILILGALLCLYQGWIKDSAPFWLIFGFLLTGAAGLIGGLIGFIVPCISSIIFLVWSGRLKRAGNYDGALAFGVMIIMLLAWASFIGSMYNGRELINISIKQQIISPIYALSNNIYLNLEHAITTIAIWSPWLIVLFFLPWEKAYRLPHIIITCRKTTPSQNWLWIVSFTTIVSLLFINTVSPFTILFLYPIIAIITAQALYTFSNTKSRRLYFTISMYFLLLGLGMFIIMIYPFIHDWLYIKIQLLETINAFFIDKKGIPIIATVFIILSIVLLKFTHREFCFGSLFITTLWTIPITFLLAYYTTPLFLQYNATTIQNQKKPYTKNLAAQICLHRPTIIIK